MVLCFEKRLLPATHSSAQALHSGLTLGNVQGTIWDSGVKT